VIGPARVVLGGVALALAASVGIVVGAGPLADRDRSERAANPAAAAAGDGGFAARYAAATALGLYAGRLADQSVALVVGPGAHEQTVEALVDGITTAGGSVSTRVDLRPRMTAVGEKALVDSLGAQLVAQAPALATPDATTYPRTGQLVGRTVAVAGPEAGPLPPEAATVQRTLETAGLAAYTPVTPGAAGTGSPLVLVVLGDDLADPVVTGLVQGLVDASHAVVAAGSTASGRQGDVAALRALPADPRLATVDGVETAPGQVSTVLTLVRQVTVAGGAFGASGIDGPAPLG
jgi:hypothetical protein